MLSLFVPGLSQMMEGRLATAFCHFVGAVLLWFVGLGWVVHLISAGDALMHKADTDGQDQRRMAAAYRDHRRNNGGHRYKMQPNGYRRHDYLLPK